MLIQECNKWIYNFFTWRTNISPVRYLLVVFFMAFHHCSIWLCNSFTFQSLDPPTRYSSFRANVVGFYVSRLLTPPCANCFWYLLKTLSTFTRKGRIKISKREWSTRTECSRKHDNFIHFNLKKHGKCPSQSPDEWVYFISLESCWNMCPTSQTELFVDLYARLD